MTSSVSAGAVAAAAPTRAQTLYVFMLFIATDVLLSVDAGALPVALPQITGRFGLTRFLQGTVGALSPAGFALATTCAGVLLTRLSPRRLLIAGLAVTAASSAAFAAAPSTAVLLVSRLGYGTAYAVFFVFAPVWISMFAPEDRATSWIGLLQAGAPVGAVMGLVCGGVVAGHDVSWRTTFALQAGGIAACTAAFMFVPSRFVDGDQTAAAGAAAV
jgi:MFS transporter, ACS family, D-galactonate transporter